MNHEVSQTAKRVLLQPAVDRCEIIDDIVKTLREDGLHPEPSPF